MWSCCRSFSQLLARSHCSEILIMRTSNLPCPTSARQMPDPLFICRREQLVELAARHTMPGIYPVRVYPEIGGLMSYGSGYRDLYERSGIYVGKILEGAKPADLPIQQIGDQSQDG